MNNNYLGFDIGATKIAWGLLEKNGKMVRTGKFGTPTSINNLVKALLDIIEENKALAVGIGIAGTITADHRSVVQCTNIPSFSPMPLVQLLENKRPGIYTVDNDARCALIGEIWQGSAHNYQNAILLTLGTGVGGAIMQAGKVLPHPPIISQEISHLMVDPSDVFPAVSGPGTVEALIGGKNIEERFQVDLSKMAEKVRKNNPEAIAFWNTISGYFEQSLLSIHAYYGCDKIIIGGIGSKELDYYLQKNPPCPVAAAKLGQQAGLVGAVRLAIDSYQEHRDEQS